MHTVTIRHNAETAHRLPHLGGKCRNLHGHSWWIEVAAEAPALAADQTVVEFGAFKRELRGWIDQHLDHGAMLGRNDPLLPALRDDGTKLFVFGGDEPAVDLPWPTVEAVAVLIRRVAEGCLIAANPVRDTRITAVRVEETHVNSAGWRP